MSLTIVTYHYVREISGSRFPGIKGLELQDFCGQLDYIRRHYYAVSMVDLLRAVQGDQDLPGNAVLLTFDDGLADHYATVFPLLSEMGVKGSFFPCALPLTARRVLDVHKIHFLLAEVGDAAILVQQVMDEVNSASARGGSESGQAVYERIAKPGRFDDASRVFVKRALQRELPEELRSRVVDRLFKRFVSEDEAAFAEELYMSVEQLRHMKSDGMFIGCHGFDHTWLGGESAERQRSDLDQALQALHQVGLGEGLTAYCHAYGSHNPGMLKNLESRGFVVGLSTVVGLANVAWADRLSMPRLDTNDLPRSQDSIISEWTKRVSRVAT